MRSSDDLDRVLGEALVSYCDVEPRPGIEARVLHRVRALHRRWGWLVLIPVLGALILAVALEFPSVAPSPVRYVAIVEVPKALVVPAAEVDRTRVEKHRRRMAPAVIELPRKSVFPTPTPLTPEEQAMVSLASRRLTEALMIADQGETALIKIPELWIEPLRSDGD